MVANKAHMIVFGNEKGGTGKSTTAMHVAIALAASGKRVAAIDLDARQKTLARYLENRRNYVAKHDLPLTVPEAHVVDGDDQAPLDDAIAAFSESADFVIIDTPGRDSALGRAAMAKSDTLVTPINDSFVDFDLIGEVDPDSFKVKRPSFYSELIWDTRKIRARTDGGTVDWVILRNRLAHLEARNMRRVGDALGELSKRVGFRVIPGLSERVIYRELFPRGLTMSDAASLAKTRMAHVGARQEVREMVGSLALPGWAAAPAAEPAAAVAAA